MKKFYNFWIIMGYIGVGYIGWTLYYLGAPVWIFTLSIISIGCIEFGCFAARDKKHHEDN